jgi:hypothetical protein
MPIYIVLLFRSFKIFAALYPIPLSISSVSAPNRGAGFEGATASPLTTGDRSVL